jgi:hypothetical protein
MVRARHGSRPPGPGQDTFEAPSVDGAVRAPFTKLVAYIWPAVALGPTHAGAFLADWERDAVLLAASPAAAAADPTGALGVAAARARHVPEQAPFSIHSLLGGMPPLVGNLTPSVPLPVFFCFLGVALGTLVVFMTMLWDLGVFSTLLHRGRRSFRARIR